MEKPVLGQCPVCDERLHVKKLQCQHCRTTIEGDFVLDKFTYLSKEDKAFIEIFVKNRGNIKEIEKEMGLSYPTVRRNLERVIKALGYNTEEEKPLVDKQAVLEQLQKKEITSEEALKLLKGERYE